MWVARDKNGALYLYNVRPVRTPGGNWTSNADGDPDKNSDYRYDYLQIDGDLFLWLGNEHAPVEVELK